MAVPTQDDEQLTVKLDEDTIAAWAKLREYLPTDDLVKRLKKQRSDHGDLTELTLDGIEAVTDEFFFVLNHESMAGLLTKISCVGCLHITDYGIELLAKAAPKLRHVVLDCCQQITQASLHHLASCCQDLESVSVHGTAVTHLPPSLPAAVSGALQQTPPLGCPLISTELVKDLDDDYSRRYKLAIMCKHSMSKSVLSFLTSDAIKSTGSMVNNGAYHRDVTLANIEDFTFNVIECHFPRTMYIPFISPRTACVLAFNLSDVENPVMHITTLSQSVKAQAINTVTCVLVLHDNKPEVAEALSGIAKDMNTSHRRQRDMNDGYLDEEAYYNQADEEERDFYTQVQGMRTREHQHAHATVNIFAVNQDTDEVQLIWPKRAGSIGDEGHEGDGQENAKGLEIDVDLLKKIGTADSIEELQLQREQIMEENQQLMAQVTPVLEQTRRALDSLSKKDVSELKSFSSPPAAVLDVLEPLAVVLGYSRKTLVPDWKVCKMMLSSLTFLQDMVNFDLNSLDVRSVKALKKFVALPDRTPEVVRKFSNAAAVFSQWLHSLYSYHSLAHDSLHMNKQRLAMIMKKIEKIDSSDGLHTQGPLLIQGMLQSDLRKLHRQVCPYLHMPQSTLMVAVHEAVEKLSDVKVFVLQRVMESLSSYTQLTPLTVKKALKHMHNRGDIIYVEETPSVQGGEPMIVADIPWFLGLLRSFQAMTADPSHQNQDGRVRFLSPDSSLFTKVDMAEALSCTQEQIDLILCIFVELGFAIEIPYQQMKSSEQEDAPTEPVYFSFVTQSYKPYIREGVTEGKASSSQFVSNFWPDVHADKETMALDQSYRFNSGMPLALLPRVIGDCLQMGFGVHVYNWAVVVRHAAAEMKIQHNINLTLYTSMLDVELRMCSLSHGHILNDYMWSIFSRYLLLIEYHASRFPHLSVRARIPCRGSCTETLIPHKFNPHSLPRKLGIQLPCPKCQEEGMSAEETAVLLGRQHPLPYHNMADGHNVQIVNNPYTPFSFWNAPEKWTSSMKSWRCFVCHITQPCALKLWLYETSIYPTFGVNCFQPGTTDAVPPVETTRLHGNILSLNEGIPSGVAMLKSSLIMGGITWMSFTFLTDSKVSMAIAKQSVSKGCLLEQEVSVADYVYELHSGVMKNKFKMTEEVLEKFGKFDRLSLHVRGNKYAEGKTSVYEMTEISFRKNDREFARQFFPRPFVFVLMLERDAERPDPAVLINCPQFPLIRSHHFPLGSSLLYKQSAGLQWTVGQVLQTSKGYVTVGDSQNTKAETHVIPVDSEHMRPVTHTMAGQTVFLEKKAVQSAETYVNWSLKRACWPAPGILFQKFIDFCETGDVTHINHPKIPIYSWRCSASSHSPEVLYQEASKMTDAMSLRSNMRRLVLLPKNLTAMNLFNPHRNVAHDWANQSLHLLCPGVEMNIRGYGSLSGVSDVHFVGVAPKHIDQDMAKFLLGKYADSFMYTYHCLTTLKHVILAFDGCPETSTEELDYNLRQYMEVYLSTAILIVWSKRFPSGASDWVSWPNIASQKSVRSELTSELLNTAENLFTPKQTKERKGDPDILCPSHRMVSLWKTGGKKSRSVDAEVSKLDQFIRCIYLNKNPSGAQRLLADYSYLFRNLTFLALNGSKLDALPGVEQCQQLVVLRLARNKFRSIPPGIAALRRTLRILNIKENPLDGTVPSFVCQLTALERLLLSFVRELPEDFGQLRKLQSLILENSTITRLPASFAKLRMLEELEISGVKWPLELRGGSRLLKTEWLSLHVPLHADLTFNISKEEWSKMFDDYDVDHDGCLDSEEQEPFLKSLFNRFPRLGSVEGKTEGADDEEEGSASSKHEGQVPAVIFACRGLRRLTLQYTAIKTIPDEVSRLYKLVAFFLKDNIHLETVSTDLGRLKKLKEFTVLNCPRLRSPPPEVVAQGRAALIAYVHRLSQGSVACHRTKLMFVGLGGAGKTSLMRALMSADGRCQEVKGEGITDGIDISTWTVPHSGKSLIYSVWDFAGQTVYYNTHQYFLSKRAVYMLIWNTRLGYEHSGLNFWLASIACHTPTAPIFIVGTHADQISKSEIPMEKLKERFPNIVAFMRVSSMTGEGVMELLNKITEVTAEQPYIGEIIPEAWITLEKLVLSQRSQISVMDWDDLCKIAFKAAISGPEVRRAVLFLHELGTLQYFDNKLLRDRVVINPQWIVDVMACLVSVRQTVIEDGCLRHEDISKIWEAYPENLHEWLLRLTEVFDLTFPLKDRPVNIVPCLLPQREPKIEWPLLSEDMIETKMVYVFDYLPAGLFNRTQVRLYEHSDSSTMWKEGSVLKKNGHMALIQQTKECEMTVKVVGCRPENIVLLVHEVIEGLISEFFQGVKYQFYLPCTDCIKKDVKDPAMFSSVVLYRSIQLKALFLQCHNLFHTLSITAVRQLLPPASAADYSLQLESALQELDDLHEELDHDIFVIYSGRDVPADYATDVLHPRQLVADLQKAGLKCYFEDKLEDKLIGELASTMRNSKMFLVLISNNFVTDEHCARLLNFALNNVQPEYVLAMVGHGREWQQSEIGMKVAEQVYINFQRMGQYKDRLKNLIERIHQKLGMHDEMDDESRPPEVFLSYCWSNSETSVSEGIAKPKDGSLGAGDPRKIKQFLEEDGLKVWLDLEQTGKAGLFEDIAVGMKKAKVVVACISDEYVQSANCQMEFRFAHIALRKPVVLVVVGTGMQWEATEIGMLSLGYPKVNFIVANNLAHKTLLQQVRERVEVTPDMEPVERPMSSASLTGKEMAFQELYELAQRKFLRQVSSYVEANDLYPRLFVADLNYDPAESSASQDEAGVDDLQLNVENEEADGQEKKMIQYLDNGMFCIKTLCEYEGGWHAASVGVSVELGGKKLIKLWKLVAPYMARLLAILKHSNINLHVIQHADGAKILEKLEEKARIQPQVDLKPLYLLIRDFVKAKDVNRTCSGLSRCYLPSGKVLWLCDEHSTEPRVTVLQEDYGDGGLSEEQVGEENGATPEITLLNELSLIGDAEEPGSTDAEAAGAMSYPRSSSTRPRSSRPLSGRPPSAKLHSRPSSSSSLAPVPKAAQTTTQKDGPPSQVVSQSGSGEGKSEASNTVSKASDSQVSGRLPPARNIAGQSSSGRQQPLEKITPASQEEKTAAAGQVIARSGSTSSRACILL